MEVQVRISILFRFYINIFSTLNDEGPLFHPYFGVLMSQKLYIAYKLHVTCIITSDLV